MSFSTRRWAASASGAWGVTEFDREARTLFMVIERFKGRDPAPIYSRLREQGRALPDGLHFVASWVEANFDR